MVESRYKAYISYSHKDEVLAAWLHRALESYRIPRGLVGRQTSAGEIPGRISPVFRDRDDLSSATDLEGTVKDALTESENLIVLCSPDAAASHWVNEEIRQFAQLGRTDRVFCIIVGGELAADGSVSNCFPAALAEIGLQEPLAADVRDWADGKSVAKLKLTAGLLGVRLDELLRRDLKRRRKRQLIVALGVTAALVLAVITIFAQISERQEREKTEQLATFIVDLGERLQSDVDLETRALIGEQATAYFENLNLDKLSPETGIKVAIAIRQLGLVSEGLGRPDEALESYQQSRDLLSTLVAKYPGMPGILFQLAYTEFYIGNLQLEQGRFDEALDAMQRNYQLNQELVETDPDNADWIMELAYAHNNLAALQLNSGKGINKETLSHVAEATRLTERVLELRPDDEAVADGFSTILAWAADAQLQACNLEEAALLRGRSKELANSAARSDPGNYNLKLQHTYALAGAARLQIYIGRYDLAEQYVKAAISILQQLSAADPSNVVYRREELYRRSMLAALMGETGQFETAKPMMQKVEREFELNGDLASDIERAQDEHIKFLLSYAGVEFRQGQADHAKTLLQTATKLVMSGPGFQAGGMFETAMWVKVRYQWWELTGEDNADLVAAMPALAQQSNSEFRSCIDAESAARLYIIHGDTESAAREVAYLRLKGYAAPAFIRFCTKYGLCEQ
jgi:tetratricopeptide (TPR) repeat protein